MLATTDAHHALVEIAEGDVQAADGVPANTRCCQLTCTRDCAT
jgi:hypothetical protein